MTTQVQPTLRRELGLLQATAVNMIDMVGIGPFVVMSLVIDIMAGPYFLWAWMAGAVISLIDGLIWSELGAAYPHAGGSYNFLREAYGKDKWGKLMSFLFVWQTMIQAPLVVASGSIGFAQYLGYLIPAGDDLKKVFSGSVVIVLTVLLYRRIATIGKISVLLWAGVLLTLAWIIFGGLTHGHPTVHLWPGDGVQLFSTSFFVLLGQASVKTIYSYLGYYNVCHLGSEIKDPEKNIPRSIFLSVVGIAILYVTMNISITSVIPWEEARTSEFLVSLFIERLYGPTAAAIVTALVLWVAFASLFAVMLGYTRIPYAAAANGEFFPIFARLHPTKAFPHVALIGLGSTAFVFSLLFRMSDVITAILAMRIVVQFIGQSAGVVALRRRYGTSHLPFRMWLYPLPVVLAIAVWMWIFLSTGWKFAVSGLVVITAGLVVFLLLARRKRSWPFGESTGRGA